MDLSRSFPKGHHGHHWSDDMTLCCAPAAQRGGLPARHPCCAQAAMLLRRADCPQAQHWVALALPPEEMLLPQL